MARSTSDYAAAEATPHLLEAVVALRTGDRPAHNRALVEAAAVAGWPAVLHRLDVAATGLLFDARLDGLDDRTIFRLLPEVASVVPAVDADDVLSLPSLLTSFRDGHDDPDSPALESARRRVLLVTFLIDRLGYPPEVLA